MLWIGFALLGCAKTPRVAQLERELAEVTAERDALQARLEGTDTDRREARLAELRRQREDRQASLEARPAEPPLIATPREALSEVEDATRLARMLPHIGPEGTVDGHRLSALRRNSVGDRVGLANGDVIHTVNGLPLTGLEELMVIHEVLMDPAVTHATVEITRRGEAIELTVPLDELPPERPIER